MDTTELKSIKIKLNTAKSEEKKRVQCENWKFDKDNYLYENQLKFINNIKKNNMNPIDYMTKLVLQQINRKIYGYKQQDLIKKKFNEECFISIDTIIDKIISCELKCYYCSCELFVLYDVSRETKQWSVDRIDNDLGHNKDNFHIACLECNLKRRCRTDSKYLFTKQLKIIKTENNDTSLV